MLTCIAMSSEKTVQLEDIAALLREADCSSAPPSHAETLAELEEVMLALVTALRLGPASGLLPSAGR